MATQEMYRTFNCGAGLVVVVDDAEAEAALALLAEQGEAAWRAGAIVARAAGTPAVTLV